MAEVSNVYVYQARYRIPVSRATAGNLVLIEGIDATITKTATVVSEHLEQEMHIFRWGGVLVLCMLYASRGACLEVCVEVCGCCECTTMYGVGASGVEKVPAAGKSLAVVLVPPLCWVWDDVADHRTQNTTQMQVGGCSWSRMLRQKGQ